MTRNMVSTKTTSEQVNATPNGQKTRSLATQTALMEAAESLIAEHGVHNVSIKDIVLKAEQKNPSVLQYHFKNLQGLIDAIHQRRNQQTHVKRAELLAEKQSSKSAPTLRNLCELMVYPTFLLAKADKQYRAYVAAFSLEIALTDKSAYALVSHSGGGGESGQRLGKLLRAALPDLDDATYTARMDLAVRMCSAAMCNHMRQKGAMSGPKADFFINNLVDALAGLLAAKPR